MIKFEVFNAKPENVINSNHPVECEMILDMILYGGRIIGDTKEEILEKINENLFNEHGLEIEEADINDIIEAGVFAFFETDSYGNSVKLLGEKNGSNMSDM